MKSHAINSHLKCIANNLAWTREAIQTSNLEAQHCPGREVIMSNGASQDRELGDLLDACERACVGMREAFNRRNLGELAQSSRERSTCLEKLTFSLKRHGYAA